MGMAKLQSTGSLNGSTSGARWMGARGKAPSCRLSLPTPLQKQKDQLEQPEGEPEVTSIQGQSPSCAKEVQGSASTEVTERNARTCRWWDKGAAPAAQDTPHTVGRVQELRYSTRSQDTDSMAQLLDSHMSPRTNCSSPTLSTSLLKCWSLLPTFPWVPHQVGW